MGHEIEQDPQLRSLGEASHAAEHNAEEAILHLAKCVKEKHMAMMVAMITSLTSMILAGTMAVMVYGPLF